MIPKIVASGGIGLTGPPWENGVLEKMRVNLRNDPVNSEFGINHKQTNTVFFNLEMVDKIYSSVLHEKKRDCIILEFRSLDE